MTICNPYIKDPANIKWLEDNEESMIDYMAKHHSIYDIMHTVLHIDTFDDNYISNLIKKVESADKRKIKEERNRKRKLEGKSVMDDPKASKIEKKQAQIEEAILARQKQEEEDSDLLD